MTADLAKVCCSSVLLAHSANSIMLILCLLVIKYFSEAILRLLCQGTTAPRLPYANADVAITILFMKADDTVITKEHYVIKILQSLALQSLALTTRFSAVQSCLVDIKCFILLFIN